MTTDPETIVVLGTATVESLYLLVVLGQIRRRHSSPAWGFIFTGLALLSVECISVVLSHAGLIHFPRHTLDWILLAKATCYAIGFTVWKHDLNFSDYRRRTKMPDKPEHPEHPQPTPAPAPAPKPSDPQPPTEPPGDPQGPGR